MRIIEMLLDDLDLDSGVHAISIVHDPAIKSDFITLSGQKEIQLKVVDEKKRILMGASLIPDIEIPRKNDETGELFAIKFSADTIRKVSERFLSFGKQNKSTLEHEVELNGMSVVESWIVEGEQDKSRMFGLDVPVGTWMVSMKVNNEQIWTDFVQTGKVKGFSIEGFFAQKAEMAAIETWSEAEATLEAIKSILSNF